MEYIKEKSKTAFNQQAATYDNDIKGQHARNLYPTLIEKLSSISYETVLDLGCGTGAVLKSIINEDCRIKAYGIDLSENMLYVAEEKLRGTATLVLGDSENLPFENEYFDVVYCNDSFHHYPKPKEVITEVHRVLKSGGTFIICDCWQPLITRNIMNTFIKFSNEGDVKIYSEKEMRDMLSINFQEVHWEVINKVSCLVYTTKKIYAKCD